MQAVAVVASGAISALGVGDAAFAVGAPGERPETAVRADAALKAAGLEHPFVARAPELDGPNPPDRAGLLLGWALGELLEKLERALPAWRGLRLGLVIGTSGGGMASLERLLAARARGLPLDPLVARQALYDGPLAATDCLVGHRVQVLAACASSTIAIGLGCRWLDGNHADLVIAGGYDALSELIATGFEALGATTSRGQQPFRRDRDGMALGEAAALLALVRAGDAPAPRGYVLGFGATSDATHVTAPDPEGRGLARAAALALADAGLQASDIELVSAHATSTRHNDGAEAAALSATFGDHAPRVVVHPFKAVVGHTLGAAGALESLSALSALASGVLPAALGAGPVEPGFSARLLERNASGTASRCLKLSAGFGGVNAALILAREASERLGTKRPAHGVALVALGEPVRAPELEVLRHYSDVEPARLERLSAAGVLAATAAASALRDLAPADAGRTGVVLGTCAGCLDENLTFDARRRERGAGGVERRAFPRTSPNLPAGECAIVFGFRGPAFAVGGGPSAALQALLIGYDLVAAGDAERALVVLCDELGGAGAEIVRAAGFEPPVAGAQALVLGPIPAGGLERSALARALSQSRGGEAGSFPPASLPVAISYAFPGYMLPREPAA